MWIKKKKKWIKKKKKTRHGLARGRRRPSLRYGVRGSVPSERKKGRCHHARSEGRHFSLCWKGQTAARRNGMGNGRSCSATLHHELMPLLRKKQLLSTEIEMPIFQKNHVLGSKATFPQMLSSVRRNTSENFRCANALVVGRWRKRFCTSRCFRSSLFPRCVQAQLAQVQTASTDERTLQAPETQNKDSQM